MTLSDQIRCNKMFKQVLHERRESEINYIKKSRMLRLWQFQWENICTEDKLMQNFLDILQRGEK